MSGTLRLVVARYKEDLRWLNSVDKRWHRSIVTKGAQVPNTGREASSYLWAMEHLCYEDDGWVCFVQGDPFEHFPALLEVLNDIPEYPLQYVPLGKGFNVTDGRGQPDHYWESLPVREYFETFIGKWPVEEGAGIQFAPGAQFIVPAAYIRGKTKDDLRELRAFVDGDPSGAYSMERLWQPWLTY